MTLAVATALTGCGNADAPDQSPAGNPGSPIEISVKGVTPTRSIITGSTMPAAYDFSLFATYGSSASCVPGGDNIRVESQYNTITTASPLTFPENTERMGVFAIYPYDEASTVDSVGINVLTQEDYLYGTAVDDNDVFQYATASTKKVQILFSHVLARITLNISAVGTDAEEYYHVNSISLGGDSEGSYREATLIPTSGKITNEGYGDYKDIPGSLNGQTVSPDGKTVTADFLVIPSSCTWWIVFNTVPEISAWTPIPARGYEAGYQYSYNVIITKDNTTGKVFLSISDCQITPWQDNPSEATDIEANVTE